MSIKRFVITIHDIKLKAIPRCAIKSTKLIRNIRQSRITEHHPTLRSIHHLRAHCRNMFKSSKSKATSSLSAHKLSKAPARLMVLYDTRQHTGFSSEPFHKSNFPPKAHRTFPYQPSRLQICWKIYIIFLSTFTRG